MDSAFASTHTSPTPSPSSIDRVTEELSRLSLTLRISTANLGGCSNAKHRRTDVLLSTEEWTSYFAAQSKKQDPKDEKKEEKSHILEGFYSKTFSPKGKRGKWRTFPNSMWRLFDRSQVICLQEASSGLVEEIKKEMERRLDVAETCLRIVYSSKEAECAMIYDTASMGEDGHVMRYPWGVLFDEKRLIEREWPKFPLRNVMQMIFDERIILVMFPFHKIVIGSVHLPKSRIRGVEVPLEAIQMRTVQAMEAFAKHLSAQGNSLFLCGDWNCNVSHLMPPRVDDGHPSDADDIALVPIIPLLPSSRKGSLVYALAAHPSLRHPHAIAINKRMRKKLEDVLSSDGCCAPFETSAHHIGDHEPIVFQVEL
eukprot:TRINITY_DN70722_c0_g1_i2.p1 TRINITY_DN70722_c0_g1~~TRINITY_DN70722_c0_g1_i2.p1  ORF type:complete len:390 (+),score=88.22 TRINITY_DN70722_c0_g1_i2:68-1171(+)